MIKQEHLPLDDRERRHLDMLKAKVECSNQKPLAKKQYCDYHVFKRGMRSLKPQRATSLTRAEGKMRCRLTWMDFDEKMYMVGSGDGLHRHDQCCRYAREPQGCPLGL